jgi:hypothetical protein
MRIGYNGKSGMPSPHPGSHQGTLPPTQSPGETLTHFNLCSFTLIDVLGLLFLSGGTYGQRDSIDYLADQKKKGKIKVTPIFIL